MGDLWVVTRSPPEPRESICSELFILIATLQHPPTPPPPPNNHRFAREAFDRGQARLSNTGGV